MGRLDGKVAVITGGTRGLGLAIAQAYAREGAAVMVASRSATSVASAVAALRATGARADGRPCDVSDRAQVNALADAAVETYGRFDIWVNNAGLSAPYGPTLAIPVEKFLAVLHTQIEGTYFGSVAAMAEFMPRRSGKLINMLGAGSRGPVAYQNAYASGKTWIRSFTLALAKEYKDSGVGIFAFQPGLMHTELLARPEVIAGYEERIRPLKTVMRMWAYEPEVPAEKAVWLASAATDGRTGLEVEQTSIGHLVKGALREGLRLLLKRPEPEMQFDVTSVPAAQGR